MEEDLLLVFDAGTQSIRCALIGVDGRVLDFARTPIQPYFSDQPGFAEQHTGYFWQNFCAASQQLICRDPQRARRIKAVVVTSQRGTYINLDKNGEPLRPAITWLDRRMADRSRWAPYLLETGMKAVGVFPELDRLNRQCFSNWVRQHQPEVWDKTHKYLLLSGFFHYKLTGRFVESLGNNFGYMPVDGKTFGWAGRWDLIHLLFPIEAEKLPDLVAQGEAIGQITRQASQETGIPEGVPVIASSNDKACEVLGAGVLDSHTACLSFGTLATVDAVSTRFIELMPFLHPYPAAVPGYYLTEVPIVRGFWMVRWFLEEFGQQERQHAVETGIPAEELLSPLLKQVPPGSHGLILQPYWSPNQTYCGKEGRGGLIGFSDVHTRAHLYRAIVEGIMYALLDGLKLTSDKYHQSFTRLLVSGGGAQSAAVCQIAADVFGMPVERPEVIETSAIGAAINGAVGLGYYPDYAAAVQGMTRISQVFQPGARSHEIYDQLYQRVYRKMYRQLEPLYREMYTITAAFPDALNGTR